MILCKSSRCTPALPVPAQRGCGRLRLSHSLHEPSDQEQVEKIMEKKKSGKGWLLQSAYSLSQVILKDKLPAAK